MARSFSKSKKPKQGGGECLAKSLVLPTAAPLNGAMRLSSASQMGGLGTPGSPPFWRVLLKNRRLATWRPSSSILPLPRSLIARRRDIAVKQAVGVGNGAFLFSRRSGRGSVEWLPWWAAFAFQVRRRLHVAYFLHLHGSLLLFDKYY